MAPDAGVQLWFERSAVGLSLWLGGVGLAAAKGVVYIATGSSLVRASMFDSLGDVFSSLIMALTQWRVNDHTDMHRYPMGKGRFAPLGVLFFCAFMCSTMLNMVLEAVQALFKEADDDEEGPSAALRKLLTEEPRLRWASGPLWTRRLGQARREQLVEQYAAAVDSGENGLDALSLLLLGVCVAVKVLLWLWCRRVERHRSSEIVAALAVDHRNDMISNSMVILTMLLLGAWDGHSVEKVDSGVSLLLSTWILYGWISNALEQFRLLSDQRADHADVEAITSAVETALQGSSLDFQGTEVYHVGDSLRVQLRMCPASSSKEAAHFATLFDNIEGSVRRCCDDVQQVDVHLRTRERNKETFEWVKGYAT